MGGLPLGAGRAGRHDPGFIAAALVQLDLVAAQVFHAGDPEVVVQQAFLVRLGLVLRRLAEPHVAGGDSNPIEYITTLNGAASRKAPYSTASPPTNGSRQHSQVSVEACSNEIPTARTLLSTLENAGMLAGAVVTLDAMHTQTDTAGQIVAADADYILTVKANQKNLSQACKRLPWKHIPTHDQVQTGHGRHAHRAIKVTTVPGLDRVCRRSPDRPDPPHHYPAEPEKTWPHEGTVEIVHVITSAGYREAPADVLAGWVQHHRCIGNRLHWVRDVTFDEDRGQIHTESAPRVMAALRSAAISLHRPGQDRRDPDGQDSGHAVTLPASRPRIGDLAEQVQQHSLRRNTFNTSPRNALRGSWNGSSARR